MGRITESEQYLSLWARWRKAGGGPTGDPDAAEVEAVISRLPEELRSTVTQVYLHDGPMGNHVAELGCPETTIWRRLARADRSLVDQLRQRQDDLRDTQCKDRWLGNRR